MAQGTNAIFYKASDYIRDAVVTLDGGTWAVILCSDPVSALLVSETTPARGSTNINEVLQSGSYTTNGIALTMDVSEASGLYTFKVNTTTHSGGTLPWSVQSGSPTNIKSAVLIDFASSPTSNAAVCFWDMTEDGGSTAISLASRDINLNLGASGGNAGEIFTIQV